MQTLIQSEALNDFKKHQDIFLGKGLTSADAHRLWTKISLVMLENIALDPALMHERSYLHEGTIHLRYVGVTNLVPYFELPKGSPEHLQILEAVEKNLMSTKFKAASYIADRIRKNRFSADIFASHISRKVEATLAPIKSTGFDKEAKEKYAKDYADRLLFTQELKSRVMACRRRRFDKLTRACSNFSDMSMTQIRKHVLSHI